MTKIDIVSGFLGAGKTTLIKKLLKEALVGEQVVLIENEFGEIGIDGGFLKEAGIEITEMNSGCICCSLVGDFGTALKEVLEKYKPDRILIEPSGVGKLSDVMKAVEGVTSGEDVELGSAVAVVDAKKCKTYLKNFGEFFENQIAHAGTIILSRTDEMKEEKLDECLSLIREHNEKAAIITTPWPQLDGKLIKDTIENAKDLEAELMKEVMEHHHEHDENCTCGCHDHDHEHHHEHDHEHEHGHEHHHEHDENCTCGCHDHEHHHEHGHHHADDVFESWGLETPHKFTKAEIERALSELDHQEKYGYVLRAKGMVMNAESDKFIHFDYVPGEPEIRDGASDYTGRLCVIGSKINKEAIKALFA